MAVKFLTPTLQGRERFIPGVPLAFDDPGAEAYFVAAGFAEITDDAPLMSYPVGTVEIDPQTMFADGPNRGKLVMEG